ncbi:hypothetical protein B0A49_00680 [Cryomyces minteri]|uniref:SET domain-containing protein n=1 Tax=Cryomyces minteri TaxID=331657 RepID=A0A4U0XTN7_9PEZI|nr:hypothetical protein B0A49_00680 [Cryomyces minteri]
MSTPSIGPAVVREAFDKSTDGAKTSSDSVVEKQLQHLNSPLVVPSVTQAATGSLKPIRPTSDHQGLTSMPVSNNAKPPTDLSTRETETNVAPILKRKRSKSTQRPAEDQPNKKQHVRVKLPFAQLPIAAVPLLTKEPQKCGASQLARHCVNGAKPDGHERAQPNHPNAKVTVKDGGSRSPQTAFSNDLTGNNLGKAVSAVAFRIVTSPGEGEADDPAVNVGLALPQPSPEVNQINETKQGVSSRSAAVVATPNGIGLANTTSLPVASRAQDQRVKTLDTSQNTGTPGVETNSEVVGLPETASALQVRSIPLSLSEVEAVLRKHISTSQDDHEYFVKGWLRRARLDGLGRPPNTGPISIVNDSNDHGTLPKAKMRPSFPSIPSHGSSSVTKTLEFEMIVDNPSFKGSKPVNDKSRYKNPKEVRTETMRYSTTRYSTDAVDVPQHDTYVSLKRNVLGENRKRLRYVPYLEDSDDNDRAANEGLERRLRKMYDFTPNEQRPGFVRHSEKARKLGPYVEAFLEELGCNFSDVLHFLLAPKDSDYDQSLDLLDPMNRYNEEAIKGRCSNVEIQRGVPKKTLLGNSEFHGFGLYMGEKVKQYQFIGEYKGEIIGTKEMIRREVVYAFMNTWYTFKLNPEQGIDSKSAGNKIRFINNSDVKDTINVHARAMMCNTVVRFGMFAARNIEEGEELFFSYK